MTEATTNAFARPFTDSRGNETTRRDLINTVARSRSRVVSADPQIIFAYNPGGALDLDKYDELGYPHPKNSDYYAMTIDEDGKPQGDAEFIEIYEGIRAKGEIDDPILIHKVEVDGEIELICLDGATRLAAISYCVKESPDKFKRIPMMLFSGTAEEAKGAMVSRNLSGRVRALNSIELMEAIHRFNQWGWTDDEICKKLGKNTTWKAQIARYLSCRQNLSQDGIDLLAEGAVSLDAAHEMSLLPLEKQEAYAEKARSLQKEGKKLSSSVVKKETTGQKNINIVLRANKYKEFFDGPALDYLDNNKLLDEVDAEYGDVVNALGAFADKVEKIQAARKEAAEAAKEAAKAAAPKKRRGRPPKNNKDSE